MNTRIRKEEGDKYQRRGWRGRPKKRTASKTRPAMCMAKKTRREVDGEEDYRRERGERPKKWAATKTLK